MGAAWERHAMCESAFRHSGPVPKNSKTHNIHKRQKSMHPAGFEPAVPASDRMHNHALDHAATGIGGLYTVYPIWHYQSCAWNTGSVKSIRVQTARAFELLRMQIFFQILFYFIFTVIPILCVACKYHTWKLIRRKFLLVSLFLHLLFGFITFHMQMFTMNKPTVI